MASFSQEKLGKQAKACDFFSPYFALEITAGI